MRFTLGISFVIAVALIAQVAVAQEYSPWAKPGEEGSSNITILSHLPLVGKAYSHADVELEQDLSRPYAYVAHRMSDAGFWIISVKDPAEAKVLYRWVIENPDLHQGGGGLDVKYIKHGGRYYIATSYQFRAGGPNTDLGAVVFDVTGLPDTSSVREVGRIRAPDTPGGFHNIYAYKHSDGRPLLFATTNGPHANIYDFASFLSGDPSHGLIGRVPVPPNSQARGNYGYHDFYVGYDPATRQDKFYGGGAGGAHVYDITRPEDPKLVTSVSGAAGVPDAHTFVPTPDGRYAMVMPLPTYQYSPTRMFDLKPGLDGDVRAISRPIGAWTPSWQGAVHNFEVRWPYIFVSGQSDGLHIVNVMDPTNPYTVAYYSTRPGPYLGGQAIAGYEMGPTGRGNSMYEGAWGVDIRNADGLIVVSDFDSGFWTLKMDGFDGWNGHQWGMPNISSAQDWDNGPDGAPKPTQVSRAR